MPILKTARRVALATLAHVAAVAAAAVAAVVVLLDMPGQSAAEGERVEGPPLALELRGARRGRGWRHCPCPPPSGGGSPGGSRGPSCRRASAPGSPGPAESGWGGGVASDAAEPTLGGGTWEGRVLSRTPTDTVRMRTNCDRHSRAAVKVVVGGDGTWKARARRRGKKEEKKRGD